MNTTPYKNETEELTAGELDAVTGGLDVVGTVVQVVKKVAQIVTGTTGVCTDHWYSD